MSARNALLWLYLQGALLGAAALMAGRTSWLVSLQLVTLGLIPALISGAVTLHALRYARTGINDRGKRPFRAMWAAVALATPLVWLAALAPFIAGDLTPSGR